MFYSYYVELDRHTFVPSPDITLDLARAYVYLDTEKYTLALYPIIPLHPFYVCHDELRGYRLDIQRGKISANLSNVVFYSQAYLYHCYCT